jgi:hypothetical protein
MQRCMYTNPFNQQVSAFYRDDLACPTGGLKGKIAPPAKPTLAEGAFLPQIFITSVFKRIIAELSN